MNLTSSTHAKTLIDSVIEVLTQGETLLTEIDNDCYVRKLPTAFNASIGGHYRHCLDHFRSLLDSVSTGNLNYDHRERGTLVENDRFAALNATRGLRDEYQRWSMSGIDQQLKVTCKTSYAAAGSQTALSTVGREMMYAVAHGVHHYALIGIMGALMGLKMPAGFGVAPSTVKFQSELARIVASATSSR